MQAFFFRMDAAELDALIEAFGRFLRERFGDAYERDVAVLARGDATLKRVAFLCALAREPAMRSFVSNPESFGLAPVPESKAVSWFTALDAATDDFFDHECEDVEGYLRRVREAYVLA